MRGKIDNIFNFFHLRILETLRRLWLLGLRSLPRSHVSQVVFYWKLSKGAEHLGAKPALMVE